MSASNVYFPQLTSGGIGQYPISRQWTRSSIRNQMADGTTVVMSAVNPPRVGWELTFAGLTDTEWQTLASLFDATQGSFGTFVFLDPTDNLLTASEDLTAAIWSADPMIQVAQSLADPFGGSGAVQITNGGQAAQGIMQEIAGPSWYQYCLSAWFRSDTPCTVDFVVAGAGSRASQTVAVGTHWTRASFATSLAEQDDGVSFGFELKPGVSIGVFGVQAEAQTNAGAYKRKVSRNGVYTGGRFDQDELVQRTDAVGLHSTTVRITSNY